LPPRSSLPSRKSTGIWGFVFLSINYRLLPEATIKQMAQDVAKVIRWVHDHAGDYGGNPNSILVMGHSAGAQLAGLVCTDDRYLKAEGLPLSVIKGCVPVDAATYDVPLQILAVEQKRAEIFRKKFGDVDSQNEVGDGSGDKQPAERPHRRPLRLLPDKPNHLPAPPQSLSCPTRPPKYAGSSPGVSTAPMPAASLPMVGESNKLTGRGRLQGLRPARNRDGRPGQVRWSVGPVRLLKPGIAGTPRERGAPAQGPSSR
jgi:hypothetical protein